MLVNQNETHEALRQIVFRLTPDQSWHEDLTQEALLHLWLRETERPGQTESWYFQSCRFFLRNYMRSGRSVHSARHHKNLCLAAEAEEYLETFTHEESVGSVLALVSAREIVSLLSEWLTPFERKILSCLADGFGVREIATHLRVSHTSVVKHRRKIASLALRLGVEPPPKKNGRLHPKGAGCLIELGK